MLLVIFYLKKNELRILFCEQFNTLDPRLFLNTKNSHLSNERILSLKNHQKTT